MVFESAPGRVALITDAMAAAGADDGDYRLGSLNVSVRDGLALLSGTVDDRRLDPHAGRGAAHRDRQIGIPAPDAVAALTACRPGRSVSATGSACSSRGTLPTPWCSTTTLHVTAVWAAGARLSFDRRSPVYAVPDQTGRRIIVTGANSGTGHEATSVSPPRAPRSSWRCGPRRRARRRATRSWTRCRTPGSRCGSMDLADLAERARFAEGIVADGRRVHALVNNARRDGTADARFETADGFELQLGSDYLGPFALTELLLPTLLAAEAPRVVDDVEHRRADRPHPPRRPERVAAATSAFREYGQAKLADLLLATRLAEIATERGWALRTIAAHPGYTRTNLQTAGANLGRDEAAASRRSVAPF